MCNGEWAGAVMSIEVTAEARTAAARCAVGATRAVTKSKPE